MNSKRLLQLFLVDQTVLLDHHEYTISLGSIVYSQIPTVAVADATQE